MTTKWGSVSLKGWLTLDTHLLELPHEQAKVWDIQSYREKVQPRGAHRHAELELGSFQWEDISGEYLFPVPEEASEEEAAANQRVFRRHNEVVVRPGGFVLWTTKEEVGTPRIDPNATRPQRHPRLICFVDAKSTKTRTGVMVPFTAPTIHAGWAGHIALEIANLGPVDLVLRENDAIAQLTVAMISSPPALALRKSKQQTQGQTDPTGRGRGRRGRDPSR
jgi:deoxycytidine triphosphate deaminase